MTTAATLKRIASTADLEQLFSQGAQAIALRQSQNLPLDKTQEVHILVCGDTGCRASRSLETKEALEAAVAQRGLGDRVKVKQVGCFGLCCMGPVVVVHPGATFYGPVRPRDVAEILETHIEGGQPVERLLYAPTPKEKARIQAMYDIPFYQGQKRIALKNCGLIDPDDITEAVAAGRYFALAKALTEMTPEQVIAEVKDSGLRGRGGGGFPTGRKWELMRANPGEPRYVICNADEGDPGAFMDRSILEGDPHAVLEAMAIAGYAVGAHQGYIYIRAEYPSAVQRLNHAIAQARELGLLGTNILGSGFDFDIELRLGAGAFVCGEETALIASIEGKRGTPRPRPPFPAQSGLWGQPTLNNNVETYANIAEIILNGSEWFRSIGTERSPGTKVFALAGNVKNTGLVEVPMGTTLREIVYDMGGGIPSGKPFKAAQTGGPSGGCIPADLLDISMEYDTLVGIGSMMGSGGLIVMDESNCMVDVARFYLQFTQDESCGKCPTCRIGTKRMLEILDRIVAGEGTMEDIDALEKLAVTIKEASLCGLGQTAPNPVLSTLHYFRDEYIAHVQEKRCPAGRCRELTVYSIDPEKCKGCHLCARKCPVGAIKGEVRQPHVIDPEVCIKCGACVDLCKFDAIVH